MRTELEKRTRPAPGFAPGSVWWTPFVSEIRHPVDPMEMAWDGPGPLYFYAFGAGHWPAFYRTMRKVSRKANFISARVTDAGQSLLAVVADVLVSRRGVKDPEPWPRWLAVSRFYRVLEIALGVGSQRRVQHLAPAGVPGEWVAPVSQSRAWSGGHPTQVVYRAPVSALVLCADVRPEIDYGDDGIPLLVFDYATYGRVFYAPASRVDRIRQAIKSATTDVWRVAYRHAPLGDSIEEAALYCGLPLVHD